jgi:hypothetical protein
VRKLTIEARSRESAAGFVEALSRFDARLVEDSGARWLVEVQIGETDRETIVVLNAIEAHVTTRNEGPARVGLDGDSYLLEGR